MLAARIVIDADGEKRSHSFIRGLMKSVATLNYAEVQAARDGAPNETCAPLMDEVIDPLYTAYRALKRARESRQPLDLDLPERKIVLSDEGKVESVRFAERYDAHRLIEEMMILANVAAAEELNRLKRPLLFRVHEEPGPEKLDALREVAQASGFTLAKGQVLKTRHLNALLAQAEGSEFDELINITTLRSMTQAYYSPENFAHFGLALKNYAHFTSPIRRYSDLIVHRALISGHGWGKDGLGGGHRPARSHRAAHLRDRAPVDGRRARHHRPLSRRLSVGTGRQRVSGPDLGRPALRRLRETRRDRGRRAGAGLDHRRRVFPLRPRGADADRRALGLELSVGQTVLTRLAEAVPVTGGLMLELIEVDGAPVTAVSGSAQTRGKDRCRARARDRPRGRKNREDGSKTTEISGRSPQVQRNERRTAAMGRTVSLPKDLDQQECPRPGCEQVLRAARARIARFARRCSQARWR